MRILIADDETPKLNRLDEFVRTVYPLADIDFARSVKSAIASMTALLPDLVLLDMSLPTFDVAPGEPGGRPQGFGGIEVLRYMDFYELAAPVIVVTQYEAFTEKGKNVDLRSLSDRMRSDHGSSFRDCVYFGRIHDEWQKDLKKKMFDAVGKN